MEFLILEPGSENIKVETGCSSGSDIVLLPGGDPFQAVCSFGEMLFQKFEGDGFAIWFSQYVFDRKVVLEGKADMPVLELHVQFKNQIQVVWDGFEMSEQLPYQYNLSYTPFVNSSVTFEKDRNCKTFDIHFRLEFLERFAPQSAVLQRFLDTVHRGKVSRLLKEDLFLTPAMISLIHQILQYRLDNRLLPMFVESKVLELLVLVLDHAQHEPPSKPMKINSYDIEMLYEAKRILLSDFESKISLQQLSRKVGINEFKLKKGFKQLFGNTVFGYRHTVRMEKAKQIILETKLDFSDIAFMTGFEHPSNFHKAFKKYHGFTAAELRKYGKVK